MALKHLAVNETAPAFATVNENEERVALEDFQGQPLVLYFYPKDDTPGCTAQACQLRDHISEFQHLQATVLGVSPDDSRKHTKFIQKYKLPFSLLVDTDHAICEAYGVWGQRSLLGKKFMGVFRSLFVIDGEGNLAAVHYDIKPKDSAPEALKALKALGAS